jgi:hypothetical protein
MNNRKMSVVLVMMMVCVASMIHRGLIDSTLSLFSWGEHKNFQ